jgi:hypothetical protein
MNRDAESEDEMNRDAESEDEMLHGYSSQHASQNLKAASKNTRSLPNAARPWQPSISPLDRRVAAAGPRNWAVENGSEI